MKIALAQLNPTVGALDHNAHLIADAAQRARESGARLLVTPELSLCGYPPLDLLEQRGFAAACRSVLERLAREAARDGLALLVGFPEEREAGPGNPLYNSAALLEGGCIAGVVRKRLLPTYDVFDERRWFEPGEGAATPLMLDGVKLGVHICEDGWNDDQFWKPGERLYDSDPVRELANAGAGILINISASPWSQGRERLRSDMFQHACRRYGLPGALVNQVGANDDLVFDGSSFACDTHGQDIARLELFAEDSAVVEMTADVRGERIQPERQSDDTAMLARALELGVADYARKCEFREVLIGLSGGIDSALVAVIACRALGADSVRGVGMPGEYSSEGSVTDARALAHNLGCRFDVIPINEAYTAYLHTLAPHFAGTPFGAAEENIQARVRGMLLMALSNKTGALVLSTGNKSELAVGYSTLYGDMCGGLEVIGDVYKTGVYALARHYNATGEIIPRSTIEKPPSAELRPNQKDSDTLPPYDVLDPILHGYINMRMSRAELKAHGHDPATVDRIITMIDRSEYKRHQAPPVLRVSTRAFGAGRRVPIARG